jgi:ParB/RepB/Spo0J family partition protein
MSGVVDDVTPAEALSAQALAKRIKLRPLSADEIRRAKTLIQEIETKAFKNELDFGWLARLRTFISLSSETPVVSKSQGAPVQDSLLPPKADYHPAAFPSDPSSMLLPLDAIECPEQPRVSFNDIESLADSLLANGQYDPILVERLDSGRFVLAGGERRYRACLFNRDRGHESFNQIRATVHPRSDDEEAFFFKQLNANLHRHDLNPIEEARAFAKAIERFGLTQNDLAERLHKSKRYVSDALSLLNLPDDLQSQIKTGAVKPHGKVVKGAIRDRKHAGASSTSDKNVKHNDLPVTPPPADAGDAFPLVSVSLRYDTALTLCRLLQLHAEYDESLPPISVKLDRNTARRDVKAILEQRVFDVLEAFRRARH